MDTDNSGFIDKEEIINYMKETTGGDISEEEIMEDVSKW